MEGRILRRLAAMLTALAPAAAQAFSYVPMSDEALYDRADAVVLARIVEVAAHADPAQPATRYRIRVVKRLKGAVAGDDLSVVVAGGTGPYGTLVVSGAPHFDADDRTLVFLRERGDGSYAVAQHALGAFHVRTARTGQEVAWRDLSGADPFPAPNGGPVDAAPQPPRDLQRFAAWLQDRGRGIARPADYWLPTGESSKVASGSVGAPLRRDRGRRNGVAPERRSHDGNEPPSVAKYQLPAPTIVRWAEFDIGRSVDWYATGNPLQNLTGGGYGEFQQALNAWNADAGSAVQFGYRGSTAAAGGLSFPDGLNTIQFNDPDDVLGGSFDCLSGGVLATTATWIGPLQSWAHGRFAPLVEADIVVQDGVACLLGLTGNANAAELFAHEIGHALGLAHACGEGTAPDCIPGSPANEALMRPLVHADGRGATLGADDRAGIGYLYPAPTDDAGSPATPAPQGPAPGSGGGGALPATALSGLILLAALRRRPPRQQC